MKTVEQTGDLGENGAMKKRLLAVLLILLAFFPLFAGEVRIAMPQNRSGSPMLPVDAVIGQIAEEDSDEAVRKLASALREEYSFEWTQAHIAEEYRASLIKLFGAWFSETLPVSTVLFSVPHVNSDGTVGVNVRIGQVCMAFLLSGNQIVSMRQL